MPDPAPDKPPVNVGHRIVRAMFVIIFFQLFWKFGGLIVTLLVGSVFGSGPESDAYFFVTETVVFLLQTLCLKVFIPLVVPIFKEELGRHGEEAAWRFANTVLNLTALALAATVVAGMVFAPKVISLFAMGFNDQQIALSTRLMRWMLPGVFGVCLATVTYAILNSYNVFGYAAAGDGVQKIVWAIVLFAASFAALSLPRMLDVLAVGFVLSAGAMVLTHLLGLRRKLTFYRPALPGLSGRRVGIEVGLLAAHAFALGAGLWVCEMLRPRLPNAGSLLALQQVVLVVVVASYLLLLWWRARRRGTAMAKFASLAVPLLFGILFAKYRDIVTNLFASFTGTGVFSDLKYARKVGEAPNTLVIAALSIAILPHLCELATAKLWGSFANVMTKTIRIIVVFFVPLTALMVVLRQPLIALLFDRGNWTDYHLKSAGDALGLYILALPFFAIENPVQQSFFAMQRMWAPTIIGFLGTGFHILFLFIGIEWLGYGYFIVVAVVYGTARAFKNLILLAVMRIHVRILPWRPSLVFLAKALVVTAGVWAAAEFTCRPLKKLLPLDPYRRREVMIDTFNVELRDWEADNVDDFQLLPLTDSAVRELFPRFAQDIRGYPNEGKGMQAIMARYRRSPRRIAGLRRDLDALNLTKTPMLVASIDVTETTDLTVELVTRQGTSYASKPIQIGPDIPRGVVVLFDSFCPSEVMSDVVALWLRDTSPVQRVQGKPVTMLISSLAFCDDEAVDVLEERMDDGPCRWLNFEKRGLGPDEPARVADTGERKGEPEMALHLPASEKRRTIAWRGLQFLRLAGCDRLTFKARADRPCKVEINILPLDPQHVRLPADSALVTVSTDVKASERRKGYSVPLSALAVPSDPRVRKGQFCQTEFVVPDGVDFWLDNVAFVREPKGPRLGRVAIMYEVGKLIHVAVPSLAGLVAFIVLLLALRVEEAREAGAWIREKGLKKVIGKFRRKKANS